MFCTACRPSICRSVAPSRRPLAASSTTRSTKAGSIRWDHRREKQHSRPQRHRCGFQYNDRRGLGGSAPPPVGRRGLGGSAPPPRRETHFPEKIYVEMTHVSEWMRIFDEGAGRYRYKHKGTGVIRDTLMALGNAVLPLSPSRRRHTHKKKTATVAAEKTAQKLGEVVVEKGAEKIRNLLRKRGTRGGAVDPIWMLSRILVNQL